ncbi:MAG: nitroreductase family protein [Acidaminococcales bacterium]|jgi:predicted oxidoreductase (fatty acid repression mutant protein)|nr:nitroreductase family protein [Acidaminococcales bacterium]
MEKRFFQALKDRRTFYNIKSASPITDSQIENILQEAVKFSPSAFNSQSARALLLLGRHHRQLWAIVKSALQNIVPPEVFAKSKEKIDNSFAAGYGSILFFEDTAVIENLKKQFALYKDNFPVWAQQANGMLQLAVWAALELNGLGASLQHYNPLIDKEVKEKWEIPETWQLVAQMPFGAPCGAPGEKDFVPVEKRVKVYKDS